MNDFFIGLHHPNNSWPFRCAMISVISLRKRKSGFDPNDWIMDSGAFSQISKHGRFVISSDEYLEHIHRFAECGTLRAAVCQDWMCESSILNKTGLSITQHQTRTIESFVELSQWSDVPILPVLQGWEPEDYARHVRMYGEHLAHESWVGVGSVCQRNGNPDAIEDVLLAIKRERPDLRLHGFGLKITALERATIRSLLYSSDSMAWSYADKKEGGNGHDPRAALRYAAKVESLIDQPSFVQNQLFKWWS